MKNYIILLSLLTSTVSFATDDDRKYEKENVSITAKISSRAWTFGGALITTVAVLTKVAPIHDHMTVVDYGVAATLTGASLFLGSLGGAYLGKKVGEWSDPVIQYMSERNVAIRTITSVVQNGWKASAYCGNMLCYHWNDARRTHLQGTFFEDKSIYKNIE